MSAFLPPDQYDRYLEVLDAARSLFNGDLDAAISWMSRPVKAFDGNAPGSMVTTRRETERAVGLIRRLEHGFAA